MKPLTPTSLVQLVDIIERCTDQESLAQQLKGAQDAVTLTLSHKAKAASQLIVDAFELVGTHQRRRRLLEMILWPVLDKPALPAVQGMAGDFVWQFQVPVVVTLKSSCLERPLVLSAEGFDVDAAGESLVDSQALSGLSALACWPTLYRREDFYAYGPLRWAQEMVDLFHTGQCNLLQPLPIVLDPELPAARVVTFHIVVGARVSVGSTRLLTRAELEPSARAALSQTVERFLNAHGASVEELIVLDPQYMLDGYATGSPAWQTEIVRTLQLSRQHLDAKEVRLQHPAPGFFELLSEDRSIVLPATATAMPRQVLKADIERAAQAAELPLSGSYSPAIPASGMTH